MSLIGQHIAYVLGAQKNCLIETVLLGTHNIRLVELRNNKINYQFLTYLEARNVINFTPSHFSAPICTK